MCQWMQVRWACPYCETTLRQNKYLGRSSGGGPTTDNNRKQTTKGTKTSNDLSNTSICLNNSELPSLLILTNYDNRLRTKRGMAPLEMMNRSRNMNKDEAFLALLSSQRALLYRINMENNLKTKHGVPPPRRDGRTMGSVIGNLNSFPLMNSAPIIERDGMDMVFSSRISTGYNADSFGASNTASSVESELKPKISGDSQQKKMKRRRSSLRSLTSTIFGDEQQDQRERRLSILSNFSNELDDMFSLKKVSSDSTIQPRNQGIEMAPSISEETVKRNLRAFVCAIDMSAKSQQNIHAWDRKMGLKRSHSKTMRMTTRSRKKLRTLLKKDINALGIDKSLTSA